MVASPKSHKVKLKALDGDITDLKVDAIVNSVNTDMHLGGETSIAGTILRKTRWRVQDELNDPIKYPKPVPLGEIVVTKSFGLPCRYIFHLATHGSMAEMVRNDMDPDTLLLKSISDGIMHCIIEAENRELATLAVPLIATGSLQLPISLAIETHINSLSSVLDLNVFRHLTTIYMITHNKPSALKMITYFFDHLQIKKAVDFLNIAVGDKIEAIDDNYLDTLKDDGRYRGDNRSEVLSMTEEIENLKVKLRKAKIQIGNLQEEIRIANEEIDKMSAPENKPGAEVRNAPLPLAYAYNMVKSEISPMLQMEKLRRALGIVLRYFASIVFADYHASGCFDIALNKECRNMLQNPVTDGAWLYATENIAKAYLKNNKQSKIINELPSLWLDENEKKTKFNGLCHGLIQLRNEIHNKVSFDDASAKEWLSKSLPKWEKFIGEASPLLKYQLFFLESIMNFSASNMIIYHVKWIMGEYMVPQSEQVEWKEKLPKGKLYLRDPTTEKILDLSPFMAYEYSNITKTRETFCIEQIIEGKITFATLRFPDKAELPSHQKTIFTK